MDMLKKYFPHAFKATELKAFIISLVIYVLIDAVCGVVIGLLAKIPLIGLVFGLLGSLIGLYALVGTGLYLYFPQLRLLCQWSAEVHFCCRE